MYLRAPQSPRAIGDQNNVFNVVSPAPSMDSSNPEPPTPSIIQSNDFMPIYPSAVDPLPFMPSPSLEAPDSSSSGNVMFGVPPTPHRGEVVTKIQHHQILPRMLLPPKQLPKLFPKRPFP